MSIESTFRLVQLAAAIASPGADKDAYNASLHGVGPNEPSPIGLVLNSSNSQQELPPCSQESLNVLAARYQNSTQDTRQKYTFPEYVDLHHACDYDGSVQPNPDSVRQLQEEAAAQMQQYSIQPTKEPKEKDKSEKCESIIHKVEAGETVYGISNEYGTTVDEISETNDLADPSLIFVNQNLVIPEHDCVDSDASFVDRVKDVPVAVFGLVGLTVAVVGGTIVIRRKRRRY